MIQAIEQESMLRYLLGELTEEEQEAIEEKYFSNTEYFEDLLKLEENLIDKYTHTKASPGTQEEKALLERVEKLPESAFAKEWLAYIFEAGITVEKEKRTPSHTKPDDKSKPQARPVHEIIESYEIKLRELDPMIKQQEIESRLKLPRKDVPIWELVLETMKDISQEEIDGLPTDGSEEHDHYIYGISKKSS